MTASRTRRARRAAGRRSATVSAGGPRRSVKGATRTLPDSQSPCAQHLWRQRLEDMAAESVPFPYWFGINPRWRMQLEATARAEFGAAFEVVELPHRRLMYRVALDVHGQGSRTEVIIVFAARPMWECYGLAPYDYPRVFAEYGRLSKHRMPDDGALCLYYPLDPPARRWTADKGLLDLLDLVVDHLLAEQYWRATGGFDGGIWMFDEAGHGFEQEAA